MKELLQQNYTLIRQQIDSNLASIKALIVQAQSLEELVASLGDNHEKEKERIIKQIEGLQNAIIDIAEQSLKIFKSYEDFINIAFAEKNG
jgi:hypothetical protein